MPGINVTFNPNAVAPAKQFTFSPDPCHVPFGSNNTVTWTLAAPGFQGAQFAPQNTTDPTKQGVYFNTDSGWTGSQPAPSGSSGTVYSVNDNNNNPTLKGIKFKYGVNVTYNGQTYSHDPEVENDPPGNPHGAIAH